MSGQSIERAEPPVAQGDAAQSAVVLVHGLAAHWLIMAPMARRLRPNFARVLNWGYRSIWSPIEVHAARLAATLRQLDGDDSLGRVNLVTHSMGGIVTRLALERFRPGKLGRLVMIAPPNSGSRVARTLAPWLGRICPPLCQLTDHDESFVCRMELPSQVEIGVIAARGDYIVRETSTHLPCEADHLVLPGLHSSILLRRETAEQVQRFLTSGAFEKTSPATTAAIAGG